MGKMKLITIISNLSLSSMSSRSSRARVPMWLTRMKIAAKLNNLVEWILSQAPVPWHIALTCTSTNYPLITTTAELSSCSQRKKGRHSAVNGLKTHSQSLCAQPCVQKVRTYSVSAQALALSFNVGGVFTWLAGFKLVSHVTHPLQTGSPKEGMLNCWKCRRNILTILLLASLPAGVGGEVNLGMTREGVRQRKLNMAGQLTRHQSGPGFPVYRISGRHSLFPPLK